MTPPIDPADLALLLKTLPKEHPDPFPHLADLNATQLLTRRIWITGQLKALDQERQVIDSEIQALFGDAELRFGVVAPGGWVIKQRTRTSWEYSPEVRELIRGIQTQAQQDGEAEAKSSTYLCQITSA